MNDCSTEDTVATRAAFTIEYDLVSRPCIARMIIGNDMYQVQHNMVHGAKHTKLMLALSLMRIAATKHASLARTYWETAQDVPFYLGLRVSIEALPNVDFYGSCSVIHPLTPDQVLALQQQVGESVAAMLNSKGGHIFIGVTSDRFTCGILCDGADDLERELMGGVTKKLDPLYHDCIKIQRHVVVPLEVKTVPEVKKATTPRIVAKLVVLEILVMKAPTLTMFDGHFKIRSGTHNSNMTHEEIYLHMLNECPKPKNTRV